MRFGSDAPNDESHGVNRRSAILGVLAAGTLAAGCSDDDGGGPAATEPQRPGGSPTPTPSGLGYHPFNGGDTGLHNPVLAVKIENTSPALPQSGVRSADIVYVEQVEGGETRLMAIFCSKLPRRVGPVRSARVSDLHILSQFGKPAFAFSGVNPRFKPVLYKAPLYRVSETNAGSAFYRYGPKPAPYNLYGNPKAVLKKTPKAAKPRDIGFRFGPAPAGGKPVKSYTARWSSVSMTFKWSAREKRWLTYWDGRPDMAAEGGQIGGRTVVVQFVKTTRSRYRDVVGSYTPYIHTVGSGRAIVLRDGRRWDCKWTRKTEDDVTTFTTSDGKPMTFAEGQVWVVLVNDGKPVIPG